ncbi:hypothetical protein LCGC14_0628230, partial [marine sediment metagenome]
VSTEDQERNGISLAAQESEFKRWAEFHGYDLEIYPEGKSGGRMDNRPELEKAIRRACETKGILVVTMLDRLARNTRDACDICERLNRAGANLVSLKEKIDTTSAAGKMVFQVTAVFAEFERNRNSERGKAIAAYHREKGMLHGSVPYGKDLQDGGRLVENPEEQRVIRRIKDLRLVSSYSLSRVCDTLEAEGIPTKSGNSRWSKSMIRSIIKRSS